MAWIKRNLYFVIGAVVSAALLGFAGFYTYTGWKHNATEREELNKAYEELKRLYNQPKRPGFGKVDNIKLAREQQKEIENVLARIGRDFKPVAAIPGTAHVTGSEFQTALRRTVEQLTRSAAAASVLLPDDYKFSFSQQFRLLNFTGSLKPLAVQLGDIRALCDVLIQAKINSIDSIQRERASPDDSQGAQTDYIDQVSQTNDLAVLTPYQITFRSFSTEIARVLAGFANSRHGFIVQAINVEPATSTGPLVPGAQGMPAAVVPYAPPPVATAPVNPPAGRMSEGEARMLARVRAARAASAGRMSEGEARMLARVRAARTASGASEYPTAPPPVYATPGSYTAPTSGSKGSPADLKEKQLRITMLVQVVKLLPKK